MSESDELPTWAASAGQPGSLPPTHRPGRRRLLAVLATLAGLAALAGVGSLGYWIADNRDAEPTAASEGSEAIRESFDDSGSGLAAEPARNVTQDTDAEVATTTETGGAGSGDDDGGAAGSEDEERDEAPATGSESGDRQESIRHAVFEGGKVFLRGRVPSQDVAEEIATRAGAVVGPDNVVVEYEIDPDVPVRTASPLYVEDVVLFDFNSVEIEPAFLPILDLGTLLLVQNPTVTITVVTRTDAAGSEAVNMEVSEQRADAVIGYWVRQGVDPSRLIADARGEADASEDDDEETAARLRRAEFVIEGLLG